MRTCRCMSQDDINSSSPRLFECSWPNHFAITSFVRLTIELRIVVDDAATAIAGERVAISAGTARSIVERGVRSNVLLPYHCKAFNPSTADASSSLSALFLFVNVSTAQPSFKDCFVRSASCFVGTKSATCSAAFDFDPNHVAILCFERPDFIEATATSKTGLLPLHSTKDFLGSNPNLDYFRQPYFYLLFRAFN